MRATLKKLLLLDMLYAFIASALAVMVPLYMLEINLDIAEIGIILSVIPLSFMLMRIVFAAVADHSGTRVVEVLESVALIAAVLIYSLSRSARAFAVAQFGEGVRDAGFWATVRTDLAQANGKRHLADVFALLVGLRQLSDSLGRAAVGVMLLFLSFQLSFEIIFILSLAMFALLLSINKNPFKGFPTSRLLLKKIFHRRPHLFWHHAMGIALQQAVPSAFITFILPVYLYTQLGRDFFEISLMIAIFALALAITNISAIKFHMSKSAKIFSVFLMVPGFTMLPLFGHDPVIPLLLIAIGAGCGNVLTENLVSRDVRRSRNISTEVSVIYLPYMACYFLLILFGGVAVEMFGFQPVFYFFSAVMLYYVIYAIYAFRLPMQKAIKRLSANLGS